MIDKHSDISSGSLSGGAGHGQGFWRDLNSLKAGVKRLRIWVDALELASAASMTPQHRRLFEYVKANPGAFTHQIARDCGIANVPCRAGELNRRALHCLGLSLEGRRQPGHVNRFGEPNGEYRWWLCKR